MASAIFDTHAFVKRLTAAGMPEAQAEILAEEQARLIDERLATKADLAVLRTDLIALEQRLKDQLTIRLGGMLAAAVVIVGGLVKLL
ncbi:MAG: DUF1640 domain-containing protein [Geminicoccaceae bacterium]